MNHKLGFISLIVIAFCSVLKVSSSVVKRNSDTCGPSKMCNYGGKCTWDGLCTCRFDCQPMLWPTKYYCGPKEAGKARRRYYFNICEVLAHACEIQKDIPIVEYNMKKMRCEDDIEPKHSFCSNPKDHMGPCGGSTALDGSVGAGVCLVDAQNSQKWCKCPNAKTGADCYLRATYRGANLDNHEPKDEDLLRYAVKLVAISVIATLMFVVSAYLITKSCRARRRPNVAHANEHRRLSTLSEKDDSTSLTDEKLMKETKVVIGVTQGSFLSPSRLSPKSADAIAAEKDVQTRGRLSGESIMVVPIMKSESHSHNENNNVITSSSHYENVDFRNSNCHKDSRNNV